MCHPFKESFLNPKTVTKRGKKINKSLGGCMVTRRGGKSAECAMAGAVSEIRSNA
jgi:hypothetical protein